MATGARFVFAGLEELKAQLRSLPADLIAEGTHIVQAAGNAAITAIKAEYGKHVVSGHMLNAIILVEKQTGPFGIAISVVNSDPIAWLFDNGSQARHKVTGSSTGAMWGQTATPPTHIFVATMIRERRVMYAQLGEMLERFGLTVSGEAAA
jgi:hypothetical protein